MEEAGNVILGTSNVLLDSSCRYAECNFGNFITDAMVAHVSRVIRILIKILMSKLLFQFARYPIPAEGTWTPAAIAIINAGGIRSSIDAGSKVELKDFKVLFFKFNSFQISHTTIWLRRIRSVIP